MTKPGHRLDRRTVIRGAGVLAMLATSGVVVACDGDTGPAADNDTKEPDIFDLTFREQSRFRPFELVAAGFEQVVDTAPAVLDTVRDTGVAPVAPFAAVQLQVDSVRGADVVVGLVSADGEYVAAVFAPEQQQVRIEVSRDGRTTTVARAKAKLRAPFGAAFVVCENQVTALVDTGDGWRPVVTNREAIAALVDLRLPDTLGAMSFGYGANGTAGQVSLSNVKAGPFGKAGLRDPHLVQHPDGTPYVRDGKLYLTFTCAGLGFFQQAHWGVFTMDVDDPTELRQVAQLYSKRDGLLLGDHAGQIVVDEASGTFIVALSSWGDFDFDGVHVRHVTTSDDVLRGVHLLETEHLDLPTEVGAWDPAITQIDGRWHVAFVESPSQGDPFDFHPALAVTPSGADFHEDLELVGADTSMHQCEGPIIQQVAGTWYLLASDSDVQQYRVYDLSMAYLGELDAPYGTNIPHPQIVPRPDGGYLMVTFDGTQYAERVLGYGGHGDVVIMTADA